MLPADRWLEMDLTWFDPQRDWSSQIETLLERVAPLLQSVSGQRGIFLNVGWLIDLVTEWTGDPAQKLPTRSRRTARWAEQTYTQLRDFLDELRAAAERHHLPDLKIGVLFVGWGHVVWPPELKIYDFDSDWYDRHPELYGPPLNFIGMPVLYPINRLRADDYPYAAFPNGLAENAYFPDFFGAQWGHLAGFLNLDALHLRDGLTGPMVYTRNGPYGLTAPDDPASLAAFSQSVRDLFRAVKTAAPSKLVFGYSSAISPVADWRVGCVDFESLVADGYIDGWIEQTWGGAWQDWWHQLWKGWTFQTANLLMRGAMIARANQQRATPCRFYNLIETWDGWEPWDTLHQVPGKLRWAMWAFSHTSVQTPDGLKAPDGSYISWMNNGSGQLLSAEDVAYINCYLNAAQESALHLEKVYGPALVYNRALMEWLNSYHPAVNASEWVDDQAAMLMKWGVPALSSTRAEWLPDLTEAPDSFILQTPGRLNRETQKILLNRQRPTLAVGSAEWMDSEILTRLGLELHSQTITGGFQVCSGEGAPPHDRPYLPSHAPVRALDGTRVHYRSAQAPLIASREGWVYWQPPDWSEPNNSFLPKYQLGSTFPHYRTAALLHDLARAAGLSHLQSVEWAQPVTFHLWRSGGRVFVLLGNLETGVFGDSRTPRMVTLCLSRMQLELGSDLYRLARADAEGETIAPMSHDDMWLTYQLVLPPEQSAVYRVERD